MAEMGLPSILRRRGEQRSPETPSPRWHHDYADYVDYADVSETKRNIIIIEMFLDLVPSAKSTWADFCLPPSVHVVLRGVEKVAERYIIATCGARLN